MFHSIRAFRNSTAPRLSLPTLCFQLILSLASGWLTSDLWAQPVSSEATAPAPTLKTPAEPVSPEQLALEMAMREHLKLMRELRVEYHMSETPANDKQYRIKNAKLCDQGRPLLAKVMAALQAKYARNPAGERETGQLLLEFLQQNVSDSRFEGTYDIGMLLEQNGVRAEKMPILMAMAAIGENRYAEAFARLPAIIELKKEPPKMLMMLGEHLETTLPALWQEELQMQAEDAKGEPLPQVSMLTTKGEMVFELFENQAPNTVANFVELVEKGFYDGLRFHRVLENFVAQSGCPDGDGTGGPGYAIPGEAHLPGARKFFRGSIGMALNGDDANSGGSQFYIAMMPTINLNGQFTSFGRVVSGIEVLSSLAKIDPDAKKKDEEPPVIDEIIEAKVVRKRNHPYTVTKLSGK